MLWGLCGFEAIVSFARAQCASSRMPSRHSPNTCCAHNAAHRIIVRNGIEIGKRCDAVMHTRRSPGSSSRAASRLVSSGAKRGTRLGPASSRKGCGLQRTSLVDAPSTRSLATSRRCSVHHCAIRPNLLAAHKFPSRNYFLIDYDECSCANGVSCTPASPARLATRFSFGCSAKRTSSLRH